jgi:hypothetical protein
MPPTGPTVDPAKKEKFINIFIQRPKSSVFSVMKQAKFTKEDIADVALRRFLQRALPGGSIKGLKAYISGLLPLRSVVPPLSLSIPLSTSSG